MLRKCTCYLVCIDNYLIICYSHCIAEIDEEKSEELLAEEFSELQDIAHMLPMVDIPDERSKPFGLGEATYDTLDFEALVNMRRDHQTYQAAHGVRTKQSPTDDETKITMTLRRQIIRELHQALKESQDDKAVGTGSERAARWQDNHALGGRDGQVNGVSAPDIASGNAANAALAATAVTKKVSNVPL